MESETEGGGVKQRGKGGLESEAVSRRGGGSLGRGVEGGE